MECIKTNHVAHKVGVIRYGTGWLWRPPAVWVKGALPVVIMSPLDGGLFGT